MDGSKYDARIRQILPDLAIRSISKNTEGLINDVFLVNDEFVFRFAKDKTHANLERETRLLNEIRSHIQLQIPHPFHISEDLMAYPLISGESLTCNILEKLSDALQQLIADQLARFLKDLHNTPLTPAIPRTLVPCTPEQWMRIRKDVEAKLYPMLMRHQIEWTKDLFNRMLKRAEDFQYDACLVHGDLAPYHILFDPEQKRLNGIIDFGVAGTGDPALDFGSLLQTYGVSFFRKLERNYPLTEAMLKRARFYAQAIELRWALAGLNTGDVLWFLAHIAGAKNVDQS